MGFFSSWKRPDWKPTSQIYAQNRCGFLTHCLFPHKHSDLKKKHQQPQEPDSQCPDLAVPGPLIGMGSISCGDDCRNIHNPFENTTKAWQTLSITRNNTAQAGKKFYFSKLCLWNTDIFKIIFTSYTKPAGKVAGAQIYLVVFFLVKTGGRNGKSATQRKQI